jgi:transposase
MSAWARRAEDLTFDKTDDKDAVLIARLAAQLRCYLAEPVDETWGRLRHLGIRRARLVAESVSQVQQMRDLLECAWPAVLDAARQPFKSTTWHAALTVALARCDGGDLGRVSRLGRRRFDAAVRRQVARWDAVNPLRKIIDGVFTACADPAGVAALRHGAQERVTLLLADWRDTQARLADTEQRMITVLGELGLAELATSITGLSPVGAASVLAETGDPRRFATGRALVKQRRPGAPAEELRQLHRPHPHHRARTPRAAPGRLAGGLGRTEIQPRLRRPFTHLTSREHNKLSTGQAHAVLAATLLRHLHAVTTSGQRWDPVIAAGGRTSPALTAA